METRTFAFIPVLLTFTLVGCPAIEGPLTRSARQQAADGGTAGVAAPTPGLATSPTAATIPGVPAPIPDEADSGVDVTPEVDVADAGLTLAPLPDDSDAGMEVGPGVEAADAGLEDGVSCRGQIVDDCADCLQDDAFCEPLSDGRWCTGPAISECPWGSEPVAAGQACAPGHVCWQESESLHCASKQAVLP